MNSISWPNDNFQLFWVSSIIWTRVVNTLLTMEIFIRIKNDLRRMGVLQIDHPYSKIINIFHYFLIFVIIFGFSASALCFFLFNAETFNEHIDSFTPVLIGLFTFSVNCFLYVQRTKLLGLIKEFESIIENRKFRTNSIFHYIHSFSHFETYSIHSNFNL